MLRGGDEDAVVLEYTESLRSMVSSAKVCGQDLRVFIDRSSGKAQDKRWKWVKRGVPVLCEIGPKDFASNSVSYIARNALRSDGGAVNVQRCGLGEFATHLVRICEGMQVTYLQQAEEFQRSHVISHVKSLADLASYYNASEPDEVRGWVRVGWCRPEGEDLKRIVDELKTLKLSVRAIPSDQSAPSQACIFTGKPALEEIVLARAY
jgi:prolyl-tRNA synthetase